jgi:hypothetical protein
MLVGGSVYGAVIVTANQGNTKAANAKTAATMAR